MGRLELAALHLLRKTPSRLEVKTDRLQETMQYRRHTRVSCPPRALDFGRCAFSEMAPKQNFKVQSWSAWAYEARILKSFRGYNIGDYFMHSAI